MFRQRDVAAGRELFRPDTLLDERGVNLPDHVLQKSRLLRRQFVAVGIGHNVNHLDLAQGGQFDGLPMPPS